MKNATLKLLAVSIALMIGGSAHANDAPAKPAEPAEPAKAAAPSVPDLPSKPYPKNAAPFKPKGNAPAVAAAPAPEKPAAAGKPEEKMEKLAVVEQPKPATARKSKPAAHAASHATADPAMHQVMSDTVKADAYGQSAEREPYKVQARDTLERVIQKTFPTTPFSTSIMREAFMKANPQVFANGKSSRLRAGQTLKLPDAAMLRLIILGEVADKPAGMANAAGDNQASRDVSKAALAPATSAAEAVTLIAVPRQAVTVASSAGPVPEVSAEEKKKWIRFP